MDCHCVSMKSKTYVSLSECIWPQKCNKTSPKRPPLVQSKGGIIPNPEIDRVSPDRCPLARHEFEIFVSAEWSERLPPGRSGWLGTTVVGSIPALVLSRSPKKVVALTGCHDPQFLYKFGCLCMNDRWPLFIVVARARFYCILWSKKPFSSFFAEPSAFTNITEKLCRLDNSRRWWTVPSRCRGNQPSESIQPTIHGHRHA